MTASSLCLQIAASIRTTTDLENKVHYVSSIVFNNGKLRLQSSSKSVTSRQLK